MDDRFLPLPVGAHSRHPRNRHAGVHVRLLCLLLALTASAETIQFTTLTSSVIEERLAAFAGANADRERTLQKLFADAGCSDVHLVEQAVKGSKVPNVICSIEGKLDSAII